jgi:hypothetical protein
MKSLPKRTDLGAEFIKVLMEKTLKKQVMTNHVKIISMKDHMGEILEKKKILEKPGMRKIVMRRNCHMEEVMIKKMTEKLRTKLTKEVMVHMVHMVDQCPQTHLHHDPHENAEIGPL